MMLVEEGRLTLSDPVSKFLPQLADLQVSVPPFSIPTPARPCTRSSRPSARSRSRTCSDTPRAWLYGGFTNHAQVKDPLREETVSTGRDVTPAEQLERLAKVPLAHQPGSAWEYSLSTDVLGRVVEAVSGTSLGKFLAERVFAPLKMTDNRLPGAEGQGRSPGAAVSRPTRATGKPIELLDVRDARRRMTAGGRRAPRRRRATMRAFLPDAAQRWPPRRRQTVEPLDGEPHGVGPSR